MPAAGRFLICYDVAEDRRRQKVARLMEDHGRRVQYSVFECDLDEPRLISLLQRASRLIDHAADSVRVYRLCARCQDGLEVLGAGPIGAPERVTIV